MTRDGERVILKIVCVEIDFNKKRNTSDINPFVFFFRILILSWNLLGMFTFSALSVTSASISLPST